ncbi:ATP-dependent RNA helicase CHR1 [Babesia sp. Xinjiang]|uniref:ATP-dependent RNA helicase CHR1 n=1 Tax=Babesia sp. Xinjiang TaxID=462227 RepID=UPI000A23049C|nr:ATP-dependent RNA helicase CHR1 [Babesia sp. Xinjiang]ORM40271.1 ATP-dependent RNA helicase CHR1 [Babesia sp. Xinjiang]
MGVKKTQISQKQREKVTFDQETTVTDSRGDVLEDVTLLDTFEDIRARYPNSSNLNWLIDAIRDRLELTTPSPVQRSVIPLALENKDILAVAPTGSGKTLAYLIPLLSLHKKLGTIQSLILVPTVELVNQVKRELVYLIGNSILTMPYDDLGENDVAAMPLERGYKKFDTEICISTPGTMISVLKKHPKVLDHLEILVVDEADVLLEGGYAQHFDKILSQLVTIKGLKKMLFSSTMQPQVVELAKSFMPSALRVEVGQSTRACKNIRQELMCVTNENGKVPALRQIIREGRVRLPCLVFLQSVDRVKQVYRQMKDDNLLVERLTGKLAPSEREELINRFRLSKIWVLLCTNILARGVDFRGIGTVVNFDMPLTEQDYINRIGRSGRGENSGSAITFFTLDDVKIMRHVLDTMQRCKQPVPEYLLRCEKKRADVRRPPKRQTTGVGNSQGKRQKKARNVRERKAMLRRISNV